MFLILFSDESQQVEHEQIRDTHLLLFFWKKVNRRKFSLSSRKKMNAKGKRILSLTLFSVDCEKNRAREVFPSLPCAEEVKRTPEWDFPLTSFRKDFPRWQCQIWLSMKTGPSQVIASFQTVMLSTHRTHSSSKSPKRDSCSELSKINNQISWRHSETSENTESAQQNLFVLFLIEKSPTNMICLLACRPGHPHSHHGNQEWRIRIWDLFTCVFLLPESN